MLRYLDTNKVIIYLHVTRPLSFLPPSSLHALINENAHDTLFTTTVKDYYYTQKWYQVHVFSLQYLLVLEDPSQPPPFWMPSK